MEGRRSRQLARRRRGRKLMMKEALLLLKGNSSCRPSTALPGDALGVALLILKVFANVTLHFEINDGVTLACGR